VVRQIDALGERHGMAFPILRARETAPRATCQQMNRPTPIPTSGSVIDQKARVSIRAHRTQRSAASQEAADATHPVSSCRVPELLTFSQTASHEAPASVGLAASQASSRKRAQATAHDPAGAGGGPGVGSGPGVGAGVWHCAATSSGKSRISRRFTVHLPRQRPKHRCRP
jgi:hypothetical protein